MRPLLREHFQLSQIVEEKRQLLASARTFLTQPSQQSQQ